MRFAQALDPTTMNCRNASVRHAPARIDGTTVQIIAKLFVLAAIAKCGDSLREIANTAYWLELLVDAKIVSPDKLQPLRAECDELTAIFVTILKHSKES